MSGSPFTIFSPLALVEKIVEATQACFEGMPFFFSPAAGTEGGATVGSDERHGSADENNEGSPLMANKNAERPERSYDSISTRDEENRDVVALDTSVEDGARNALTIKQEKENRMLKRKMKQLTKKNKYYCGALVRVAGKAREMSLKLRMSEKRQSDMDRADSSPTGVSTAFNEGKKYPVDDDDDDDEGSYDEEDGTASVTL